MAAGDERSAERILSLLAQKRDVMPLTVGFMQRRAGVGEHRARAMIRHLIASGRIVEAGRYLGKHGFWVKLWRVLQPEGSVTSSVRRKARVKRYQRRRWWTHELFGTHDGRPPPR